MYYVISLHKSRAQFFEILEKEFDEAHRNQMIQYGKSKQNLVDEWNLRANGAYIYSMNLRDIQAVQRSLKFLSDNT